MALVSRGLREEDDGSRTEIPDDGAAGALRLRARRVWTMTIVATLVVGALTLAAPHPLV